MKQLREKNPELHFREQNMADTQNSIFKRIFAQRYYSSKPMVKLQLL